MFENESNETKSDSGLTDYFIMEWIDINDKLPPTDENVIVCFKGQGHGSIEIKYLPEKMDGVNYGWYPGGRELHSAVYWMHLPPFPEK